MGRQRRDGALLLYAEPAAALLAAGGASWATLALAQRLELPAVFDVKWCPAAADCAPTAEPLLTAACAVITHPVLADTTWLTSGVCRTVRCAS
jgi:hypothetical protein